MPEYASETPILLVKKLGAVALLILGLVLPVIGYSNGSNGLIVLGFLMLAGGLMLLIAKIIRRNQP